MASNGFTGVVGSIAQSARDLFAGAKKPLSDPKGKPPIQMLSPGWPEHSSKQDKIKYMMARYYRECAFEKIPHVRKWMRNILMYQGYQDLDWNDAAAAWEAIPNDPDEYAFPNNQYRARIRYGTTLYMKNAPTYRFGPTSEDLDAQSTAAAAKKALEVIKETVGYDSIRYWESLYMLLMGNSFRCSYYSLDPRYGTVTQPVFESTTLQIDEGYYHCLNCGMDGYANPPACEQCGKKDKLDYVPPNTVEWPVQAGQTTYARGQEKSEAVSPMEMYGRSSAKDLAHQPMLFRCRNVDRVALQAAYAKVSLFGGKGANDNIYGSVMDDAVAYDDLSLIYQESLADLPGDPTQLSAWYERSMKMNKVTFMQGWIRPDLYSFDRELIKDFPDGIHADIANHVLLMAKNESIDDTWVHMPYILVPGRFWGDGEDDMVPKQLQLNETERLVTSNIAYNAVPKMFIDSMRINKNSIANDPADVHEVKAASGKPVKDAIEVVPGAKLSDEVPQWRSSILQDMDYLGHIFGSAIGEHQPGIDTLGGQQEMAARTNENYIPTLLLWKEANEKWAVQMLKIAAKNWLDDRVHQVEGINGQWEFTKLRGAALDTDKIKVICKVIPIDPQELQNFNQAVVSGLLDPNDPRVKKKALELHQLDPELEQFTMHAKKQWKEIEQMIQNKQPIQPVAFVHDDQVHITICQVWLNSDAADMADPQVYQLVYMHLMAHIQNQGKVAQAAALVQGHGNEVHARLGAGQPQQQPGQQSAGGRGPQGAPSQQDRQRRAQKGQMAKTRGSQPVEGNQHRRSSPGTAPHNAAAAVQ